jgi:hypothetical protein
VEGLTVGWHPYDKVLDMLDAYRSAIQDLPSTEQQELVSALVNWLEAFPAWARVAGDLGRPRPDLVAFWAR